ncbi:MAG: GspH/FimT family pseudopilin [Rubrivivax sp.]
MTCRLFFRQRGLTVVDCAVTLAIVSILAGSAAPMAQQVRSRWHLEGAAAQLETQLQFARSEAVSRHKPVRVSFASNASQSCYVVHTGKTGECDCTQPGPSVCPQGVEQLALTRYTQAGTVQLSATAKDIGFDGDTGTVTPTTSVTLANVHGQALKVVVNVVGRVRSCSPSKTVVGHPAC